MGPLYYREQQRLLEENMKDEEIFREIAPSPLFFEHNTSHNMDSDDSNNIIETSTPVNIHELFPSHIDNYENNSYSNSKQSSSFLNDLKDLNYLKDLKVDNNSNISSEIVSNISSINNNNNNNNNNNRNNDRKKKGRGNT
jgi:hypothetical protein